MKKLCDNPEHTEDVVECSDCKKRAETITLGEELK